jgi:serine/threonine-protein kinase
MELIEGETLRERRVRIAIDLSEALVYIAQTLRALVYAHALGVVHRDIKPSNIMITRDGSVKLLDFGIAITSRSTDLTHAGYLLGSLNYMSPEQVSGGKATSRSDLYAVGVTLYELLTGQLPITGASDYEVMVGHMQQIPRPAHEVAPLIPVALSAAVMRALVKDPDQRYASAEEFLRAMEAAAPAAQAQATWVPPVPTIPRESGSAPRPATASLQQNPISSSGSSSGMQSLPLEEITRRLAVYIGPVAKFVVKKLAAQSSDLDFIYKEAARQITSDTDRAAFLRMKH